MHKVPIIPCLLEGYRVFAACSHFTVICELAHRPVYGKMGNISYQLQKQCFAYKTSLAHIHLFYFAIISSWKWRRDITKFL